MRRNGFAISPDTPAKPFRSCRNVPDGCRGLLASGCVWLLAFSMIGCGERSAKQSPAADSHGQSVTNVDFKGSTEPPSESDHPATPGHSKTADNSQAPATTPRLKNPPAKFLNWPRPAAVLVLSGEQHGYIEPCGCSESQSGGLSRRADLIKQLQAKNWPVTGLDLGGVIGRDRLQSRIKYEMTLDVLKDLQYQVVGFGPEEVRLGVDYFLSKHQPRMHQVRDESAKPTFPELVAANITLYGDPTQLGPVRYRILQVGDVKIGVTAIISPSYTEKLFPNGAMSFITLTDTEAALTPIVAEFARQQTAFNVLLSHAPTEESKALAEKFPQFPLVVSAGASDEPDGKPIAVGNSTLLKIGQKAKYAGVVAFYPDGKADVATTSAATGSPRFRFELPELDMDRFENSALVETHLRRYQKDLEANLGAIFADMPSPAHPSGDTYVGAETCGDCHTKAYEKWTTTAHSHAYDSIITGREGQYTQPISRVFDTECLVCHVTGWEPESLVRYNSGYLPEKLAVAAKKPELYHAMKGQQCENCHGPGSGHVELESNSIDDAELAKGREQMRLTLETARKDKCVTCHDFENSPKFNFDKYWEEIKHPWRD